MLSLTGTPGMRISATQLSPWLPCLRGWQVELQLLPSRAGERSADLSSPAKRMPKAVSDTWLQNKQMFCFLNLWEQKTFSLEPQEIANGVFLIWTRMISLQCKHPLNRNNNKHVTSFSNSGFFSAKRSNTPAAAPPVEAPGICLVPLIYNPLLRQSQ